MSQNGISEDQLEDPLFRYLLGSCGCEEGEKSSEFIKKFQEQCNELQVFSVFFFSNSLDFTTNRQFTS